MKPPCLITATLFVFIILASSCSGFQKAPFSHGFKQVLSELDGPTNNFKKSTFSKTTVISKMNHSIKFPSRGGSALNGVNPELVVNSFSNSPFVLSSIIYAMTNVLGFVISIFTGSHLHLDLLGTGAFTLASLPNILAPSSTRVLISSSAVGIWGAKLASFLFFRALKVKTDVRLEDTLSTTGGTTSFWFISLLWGVICSLPHTLGSTSSIEGSPVTLTIGVIVYMLGLLTETKADFQKWSFKENNPGKFCNEGLWSISQHPNFFGNLLIWSGIYIMNVDSLIQPMGEDGGIISQVWGTRRAWIALLSPLFMWTLFYGQSSGAITNTLELASKKYGSDASYQSYIKNVPLIIPSVLSWLKKLFS